MNDVEEFAKEMEGNANPQERLPEAASSLTITAKIAGYSVLVTVRDPNPTNLLNRAESMFEEMTQRGYQPKGNSSASSTSSPKRGSGPQRGMVCPQCGGKVVEKTSKKGRRYQVCENNKYGSDEGCDYFRYLDE